MTAQAGVAKPGRQDEPGRAGEKNLALAGTARLGAHGMVIPALHDAASDRPIGYTPVCGQAAGVAVCLNPAYHRYLPEVTAALHPALAEVAGLPGAPVRATQGRSARTAYTRPGSWPCPSLAPATPAAAPPASEYRKP